MKNDTKPLRDKLSKAWSIRIKNNAEHRCERCGSMYNLSPHHIIGKANTGLRWEEKNGVCLCFDCHRMAHDKPDKFKKEWLYKYIGRKVYDDLVVEGSQICKMRKEQMEELLKSLTN